MSMLSIGSFCKRPLPRFHFENAAATNQSLIPLPQLHYSSPALRFLSVSSNSQNQCEQSLELVASYLVHSCGLSPDSAIHATNRVRLVNLEKSEAVVRLLITHGFSLPQISSMITKFPDLLRANPEKILLPKLNFLFSVQASEADAVSIFCNCPWILGRSLEKHIVPTFGLLRDVVGSNKKVIAAIKSYPYLLNDRNIVPNITTLRDNIVPESGICYLLNCWPTTILIPPLNFIAVVEKLKALGFIPWSSMFVIALRVMGPVSKSKWEKKLEVYRKWGWSDETTYQAFRKYPYCLALSEDKINAGMSLYVNEAGLEASYIARYPNLLGFSLEKRVIPRYNVIQVLLSKGLMMSLGKRSFYCFVKISDQEFNDKFVIPYLEKAPELLDIICQAGRQADK